MIQTVTNSPATPTTDSLLPFTPAERRLVAAYRRLRKAGKVGVIVIQWNGLVIQIFETWPSTTIEV